MYKKKARRVKQEVYTCIYPYNNYYHHVVYIYMYVKYNFIHYISTLLIMLPGKTGSRNIQQKSRPMSSTKSCSLHSSKAQLHPSWEAQRQRKARETGIPEFQGQRTVFSD